MNPEPLKWVAASLTIVAALLIAVDLDRKVTGYAFVIFAAASAAWIISSMADAGAAQIQ